MPYLFPKLSVVGAYLFLTVPLLLLIYLGFLMFIRPPKKVWLASLLGGVIVGLVNLLGDLAAYYAHLWHYTLPEVILHVPLPFYISPLLIFGSLAYLLIWRFWHGSRWLALLILVGAPLFCIVRDIMGGVFATSYQMWENIPLASVLTIVMWVGAFYAGFWLFWRSAGQIRRAEPQEQHTHELRSNHN